MRVGARASGQQIRRFLAPDDPGGYAIGNRDGSDFGCVERSAGLGRAADRTDPVMGAPVLIAVDRKAALAAMADRRRVQGIAGRDRRGKRRADRSEDLHHQRDQDDRQELLKASTHRIHQGDILFRPSRSITP